MDTIEICKLLQSTNSKKDKEQILKDNHNNDEFKSIMQFVFDPYVTTGISTKKLNKNVLQNPTKRLNSIFDVMSYLKSNNTGTDEVIANIQNFLNYQNNQNKEFYKSIVTKSLTIGCDAKSLNKIYGNNFIKTFNVMLANKFWEHEDKIKKSPFIVTQKLDGCRAVIFNYPDHVQAFTRQGQVYDGLVDIENEMKTLPNGFVYDGELIAVNPENLSSKDLYRKTVSIVRKDGIKQNVIFHVFDILPIEDFENGLSECVCKERKDFLHESITNIKLNWIWEVPVLYYGTDKDKVIDWLNYMTDRNYEGVMVNLADAPYSCKRTSDILKVKKMQSVDLKITGFEEGEGRLKGTLGRMNVNYKDQTVGCGAGFTDTERQWIWENQDKLIGRIAEIRYFEESENAKTHDVSLRFPVFKTLREKGKEESYN
ncbi:DNA_LIGASE_A3 domain-containing protein [Ruminococcaceae bacterium BL-6]|nr:DNA_LIGASE_A3 domain-containing protein [Ruminococcaceae bacterium BL-6]